MYLVSINFGSETFKYAIFDKDSLKELHRDNINIFKISLDAKKKIFSRLARLVDPREIKAVGHRYVNGGDELTRTTKLSPKVLKELKKMHSLAPLHNPNNYLGVELSKKIWPQVDHYAVFDTAFYQTLPEYTRVYALPWKMYSKMGIKRMGFHGISHNYVLDQISQKIGKPKNRLNLISVHLGGGCSVTAIKKGQAIDTSMGYTPLEGLAMMSRSGDLDLGAALEIMKKQKYTPDKMLLFLNKRCGMQGLAGTSNFKAIIDRAQKGNSRACLSFDMFVYRVKKYIASYYGILGKTDAIGFTGGIGYYSALTRRAVCRGLPFLKDVKVFPIQANEERAIALQIKSQLKK